LPYKREPLETHEQGAIEHLQGISTSESAGQDRLYTTNSTPVDKTDP